MLDVDAREISLFLDVDMDLTDSSTAAAVERQFGENPGVGAIGAVITTPDCQPETRCWGYDFTAARAGMEHALFEIAREHGHDAELMKTLQRLSSGRVAHFEPMVTRNVDWVREGFFAVRTAIFRDLGGFDPKFRMFHGGPDLCLRIRQAGWAVRFTTDICVRNLNLQSRSADDREAYERESTIYYFQKHHGIGPEQFQALMS